ncbi:MAG: helix-turn-helix domain-containing protein [Gammaproteobacteria bacterium]|nr:helix-turn-helix domain-containing protein [Gammaproteobacteria bacterium]
MNTDKQLSTSGDRLKRARVLAGISTRREFEKKYNISANTLQGWEQGKNPLSEKGARRVVEAFKWEGLLCSVEWLIHGVGMPPRPYEMLNAGLESDVKEDKTIMEINLREEENIYRETQFFKDNTPNPIILTIADDAMEPYYSVGDYVGGSRLSAEEMARYVNTACIVELENNLILPRYLQKGTQDGLYTISSLNPRSSSSPLNLYNVKIINAAPITWHRRKLSTLAN